MAKIIITNKSNSPYKMEFKKSKKSNTLLKSSLFMNIILFLTTIYWYIN